MTKQKRLQQQQQQVLSFAIMVMVLTTHGSGVCCFVPTTTTTITRLVRWQTTTTTSFFSSAQPPEEEERDIIFIEPGMESDILSDELWEEVDGAQPPKWLVMKEILGIGGFTYVLGSLIVVMLSLNFFLGPGWLGQSIGVPGTGSFTEVSPNLPEMVDLSDYTL